MRYRQRRTTAPPRHRARDSPGHAAVGDLRQRRDGSRWHRMLRWRQYL